MEQDKQRAILEAALQLRNWGSSRKHAAAWWFTLAFAVLIIGFFIIIRWGMGLDSEERHLVVQSNDTTRAKIDQLIQKINDRTFNEEYTKKRLPELLDQYRSAVVDGEREALSRQYFKIGILSAIITTLFTTLLWRFRYDSEVGTWYDDLSMEKDPQKVAEALRAHRIRYGKLTPPSIGNFLKMFTGNKDGDESGGAAG